MVDLRFRGFIVSLAFISSLVFAGTTSLVFAGDVVNFPGAGTVKLTNGGVGRVVGVTALDSNTKTATAVIDARDRFGNSIRVTRTLKAIPSALGRFGRSCISGGISGAFRCTAYSAIAAAAAYQGYDIVDGWLTRANQGYGECPTNLKPLDGPNGTKVMTFVGIPCYDSRRKNSAKYYSNFDSQEFRNWSTQVGGPYNRWYSTWDSPDVPVYGEIWIYSRSFSSSYPDVGPPVSAGELSDSEFADLVFQDPSMLQIDSGLYPDVWEPISINEVNFDPGLGTNPEPEPEPVLDMIGVDQIPEQTIDLSSYFSWGSGWLPKTCPAPVSFSIMNETFEFKYDTLCSFITTYVAPMIRFVAIMIFLNILIGGGVRV